MSSTSTFWRTQMATAVAGDMALIIHMTDASPGPTAYTVTGGTNIQNLPTRGVGYKILGASDDVVFSENSADSTYNYAYTGLALHSQQPIAANAIHQVTATASVTTTQPCMIIAISNGPITKAGSTTVSSAPGTPKLYVSRWNLVTPGADTWSSTGTWWSTVAIWGVSAVVAGGKPKVWVGGAWTLKPAKVWNGSAWVEKPVKVWSGSAWELA